MRLLSLRQVRLYLLLDGDQLASDCAVKHKLVLVEIAGESFVHLNLVHQWDHVVGRKAVPLLGEGYLLVEHLVVWLRDHLGVELHALGLGKHLRVLGYLYLIL
jgi:hypothetical protein